jgi:predicted kinase
MSEKIRTTRVVGRIGRASDATLTVARSWLADFAPLAPTDQPVVQLDLEFS